MPRDNTPSPHLQQIVEYDLRRRAPAQHAANGAAAPELAHTRESDDSSRPGLRLTPLRDLLAEPEEAIEFLVEDVLPTGGLSMLVGKPKSGKSTLARCLALSVARGEQWLGKSTHRGPVIYLALEEKRSEIRNHFRRMGATGDEEVYSHIDRSPLHGLAELRGLIRTHQPGLAIIDPLFRFTRVSDGNDYAQVSAALEPVLAIARETQTHLLVVHHANKGQATGGDETLGTTALFAAVDTLLSMKRSERYRTIYSVQRYGTDLDETVLTLDQETGWVTTAGSRQQADEGVAAEAIVEFLQTHDEPIDERSIHSNVEGRRATLQKAIRSLIETDQITRSGGGRRGDPYLYAVSGTLVPGI